jgi:hypothetical protein
MSQDKQKAQDSSTEKPAPKEAKPAEKRSVEDWATSKKMLPQFIEPAPRKIDPRLMGLPAVGVSMGAIPAPRHNPEHVKYVAARALRGWPLGKEVTEAEFDEAVNEAMNLTAA